MSSLIPQAAAGYVPDYLTVEEQTRLADEGKPAIMVIDDSPAVRAVLEASFHRIGVRAHCFKDGIEAIQALSKGDAPVPAVLLLDINLPRMGGYEVAQILRSNAQFNETVIIMLTGKDGIVDRLRSHLVGARDYIKKPFRVSNVVRTVGKYMQIDVPGPSESGPPSTPHTAPRG